MRKLNYMFPPSWGRRPNGCQPNYRSPHSSEDNRLWHTQWLCRPLISTVIGHPGSQRRTALEEEIAWKSPGLAFQSLCQPWENNPRVILAAQPPHTAAQPRLLPQQPVTAGWVPISSLAANAQDA